MYRCNVIGIHQVKYEYEWNLEHYTAFYTVFYLNVFRSIGQVGKVEFDDIGQRGFGFLQILNRKHGNRLYDIVALRIITDMYILKIQEVLKLFFHERCSI